MNKVLIDITDLYMWKRNFYTGIQKVSLNLSKELCSLSDKYRLVYFNRDESTYYYIDDFFSERKKEVAGEKVNFFSNIDSIIFFGATWNYIDALETLDSLELRSFEVIHFIHDISPLVTPQFHPEKFPSKFNEWLIKVQKITDKLIFNSEFTRKEYEKSFGVLQRGDWYVSKLSSDLKEKGRSESLLNEKYINDYVLCVGTIEPRKNHLLLYYAYKTILSKGETPPLLKIIGGEGWNSDFIFKLLKNDSDLYPYIEVLSSVDDHELANLYKNCMFTIYPSLYEGWGIPITESLSFGKNCICSRSDVFIEAGGESLIYVDPFSSDELAHKILELKNISKRREGEDKLQLSFFYETWGEISERLDKWLSGY